jgi:hypothetical protein
MALTAEQRRENSRINGRKSKGPKTDAGKKRASMNSFKHGMRSLSAALPNEDPEAVKARNDAWNDYYRPGSPAAQHLVNLCVAATLLSDRCQRSLDAAVADHVDADDDAWEKPRLDRINELWDPVEDDPAAVVAELEGFAHGCRWLILRWSELGKALKARGYWGPEEGDEAVRLLGSDPDPDALADNPVAYMTMLQNLRCQPSPAEDLIDRLTAPECRPAMLREVDRDAWLPAPSVCNELLREMVAEKMHALIAAENGLAESDAKERARALDRASVLKDQEQARLHLRYHAEARSTFHRAYKELVATLERDALGETDPTHGASSPNGVRCLTDQEILISDEGGSEEDDLRVNGLPEGETPTGHEPAIQAGASPKSCRRWPRETRVAG